MEHFMSIIYLDIDTEDYNKLMYDLNIMVMRLERYSYSKNEILNDSKIIMNVLDGIRKCKLEDKIDKSIFELKDIKDLFNQSIKK